MVNSYNFLRVFERDSPLLRVSKIAKYKLQIITVCKIVYKQIEILSTLELSLILSISLYRDGTSVNVTTTVFVLNVSEPIKF